MKSLYVLLIGLLALSGLAACKKDNAGAGCPNGITATFRNLSGLDGCGYVLELQDGSRLEVANLSELSVAPADGLSVKVEYEAATDMASICMVGPIVRVTCISTLPR